MQRHITKFRKGFPYGITSVTTDKDHTGIGFSIIKLKKGESHSLTSTREQACLHLNGSIRIKAEDSSYENKRESLFDEPPFAVHACKDTPMHLEALSECEVARFETPNEKKFPVSFFLPLDTKDEHRGKGLVDEASLRFVRTIFDGAGSHPNAELVLGEVVNFPGRWSSYPPHHHPQPEIYHYRFTKPQGYGHAELGDDVFKVRAFDTLKILDGLDHAQCSAPGYGMYYIWVIRHLPGNRYTTPTFADEHRWTMDKNEDFWRAKV